jgi:ATP-binding cassette subfamily B protein
MEGRTTIAIAHRLSTLRNANRLIVIDNGTVAEEGSHDELMEKGGIYHNLVMAQRSMNKLHE